MILHAFSWDVPFVKKKTKAKKEHKENFKNKEIDLLKNKNRSKHEEVLVKTMMMMTKRTVTTLCPILFWIIMKQCLGSEILIRQEDDYDGTDDDHEGDYNNNDNNKDDNDDDSSTRVYMVVLKILGALLWISVVLSFIFLTSRHRTTDDDDGEEEEQRRRQQGTNMTVSVEEKKQRLMKYFSDNKTKYVSILPCPPPLVQYLFFFQAGGLIRFLSLYVSFLFLLSMSCFPSLGNNIRKFIVEIYQQ